MDSYHGSHTTHSESVYKSEMLISVEPIFGPVVSESCWPVKGFGMRRHSPSGCWKSRPHNSEGPTEPSESVFGHVTRRSEVNVLDSRANRQSVQLVQCSCNWNKLESTTRSNNTERVVSISTTTSEDTNTHTHTHTLK